MESYSDLSKAAAESIEKACCQVVLSKDPVLRYQVGTKKMKMSWYQVSLSTGGTEYPVNPVLDAYSAMISAKQKTRTESQNPVMKMKLTF